jgi:branched-chain amino acid transport system permease protein
MSEHPAAKRLADDARIEMVEETGIGRRARSEVGARKIFLGALLLVLFLLPLLRPYIGSYNYVLHMMLITYMWIAMASSWNIIGGYAGYTSLGHNVFFAIGGYFSGALMVYFGISPFLTAPLAGLVAMAVGLLVGLIALRTRGPAFIISTIALILLVRIWFDNWELLGGSNGLSLPLLSLPPGLLKVPFYYGMLLAAIGAVFVAYKVRHSKFGLGLRAISQDETKAEVAGINTHLYKILAFAISGFFVGVVGALWGYSLTYLRPTVFLSISVAADMVLMAILGGKGTVAGPVLGAILLVGVNELSVSKLGSTELNIAVTGLFLIVVLLFFPEGIVGTLKEYGKLPWILDWD